MNKARRGHLAHTQHLLINGQAVIHLNPLMTTISLINSARRSTFNIRFFYIKFGNLLTITVPVPEQPV